MAALSAGLTAADIRQMKYTHLVQMLWEYDDMNGAESEETQDATAQDLAWLGSL